jgi:hypothetical protein
MKNICDKPSSTVHYNVQFKTGLLANRVTERAMCDIRPADIDWLWIVEQKRRATPEEICKLCKLVHQRTKKRKLVKYSGSHSSASNSQP